MSMADNTRKRSDFLTDSFTPKAKDPASDPLAELARLIGQSDPFTEAARKPLDTPRATAPGGAAPAPEWLARPAASHDDEPDYQPRPATHDYAPRDDYPPRDDYAPQDPYPPEDHHAGPGEAPYAAQPSQAQGHDYRPLMGVFAADGAQRQQPAAPVADAHDDARYQDGYETEAYQGDDRYRVAPPPAGDYEADSYYSEDGHMPPQGDEGRASTGSRTRSGLITVAAVFGLAIVGTAGAFGYRAFTTGSVGSANPPVIKADTTPAKIAAVPVAATTDASGKPIQDRVGAPAASGERLVSREETPMPIPTTPPRPAAPPAAAPQAAMPAPMTTAPVMAPSEPKRVKTQVIRPGDDGTATIPSAPPSGGQARAAAPKQQGQQSGAGPMQLAPTQVDPPASRSNANANTKTASRSPTAGGYVVQVSAQKTEADAQSSYRAMQAKYPSVLSGREAMIRRVELSGSGVWYRAQVGPFGSSTEAEDFCAKLKAVEGQCIVQRN
jgi:hypothetical protein